VINFPQRRFLSIALLSLTCLSFFINTLESSYSSNFTDQQADQKLIDREKFELNMSIQRKITEQVGFCIQQLLQTIDAKKINLNQKQKQHVVKELSILQNFVSNSLEKLFVQNTHQTLNNAITTNQILTDYLLSVVTTDLTTINAIKIHEKISKRSMLCLPEEQMQALAEKNLQTVEFLIQATDSIGLTWYNFAYRSMKKHNAYTIAKGLGIAAVSVYALATLVCILDKSPEWAEQYIGPSPYQYDTSNNKWKLTDQEDLTFVGRRIVEFGKLNAGGFIATSALLTIDYKSIFAYLYKDPANWAQSKASEKIRSIDQRLEGTAKKGLSNGGYEKVYFKDLVGCSELEEIAKNIANCMKYPERYERAKMNVRRCYLLHGPPQTGKTLFAKALRTLVEEELGDNNKVNFIDGKDLFDRGCPVEEIFAIARYYAPCILFFDEIDLIGTHRDKDARSTSQLLTCIQGIDNVAKQVFVIGATNRPEQLDHALLVDGRFGKQIHVEYPKYEYRKLYLQQQLEKRSITSISQEYIDCIAQETEGCSYNNLERIISEALILSSIETRPVSQKDFEKTLDSEVRKIQAPRAISQEEKRTIAIYQAGKAVARHLLQTGEDVVKVTINTVQKDVKTIEAVMTIKTDTTGTPDNDKLAANKKETTVKLGEVFIKSNTNHNNLLSDDEHTKECLSLLAGSAAQQLLLHKTFTQCNKQDRAEAMQIIYNMISNGEKVDDRIKAQGLELKNQYEKQIAALLKPHQNLILKIADILVKQNTIDRYEWKSLISSINN